MNGIADGIRGIGSTGYRFVFPLAEIGQTDGLGRNRITRHSNPAFIAAVVLHIIIRCDGDRVDLAVFDADNRCDSIALITCIFVKSL